MLMQARERLAEFIKSSGITMAGAVAQLNCGRTTLHHWIKGTFRPGGDRRDQIECWTSGFVPASMWRMAGEESALPMTPAKSSSGSGEYAVPAEPKSAA